MKAATTEGRSKCNRAALTLRTPNNGWAFVILPLHSISGWYAVALGRPVTFLEQTGLAASGAKRHSNDDG